MPRRRLHARRHRRHGHATARRTSALATVRWAYKGSRGETLWEATFSYNLHRGEGGWKILVQTMHDA